MEPPRKRLRISRPDELVSSHDAERPTTSPKPTTAAVPQQPLQNQQQELILPTRTINLSDFRRRAFHAYGSGESLLKRRNAGIYLMPRAPVATVTAKIIDVALVDGTGSSTVTQVADPTSDLVLPIGTIGTLTISATTSLPDGAGSALPGITGSPESGISGSLSVSPSSITAPINGTTVSSGDNTVTITTTSTLSVSFLNGTFVVPARTTSTRTTSSSGVKTSTGSVGDNSNGGQSSSQTAPHNGPAQSTIGGNGGGAVSTANPSSPPATGSDSGGGGPTLTPQQQQVVGGVVGGVAGIAIVLVALLYFLKWYRHRLQRMNRLPRSISAPGHNALPDNHVQTRPQTAETNRSSIGAIATVASRLKQLRPYSTNTMSTTSNRDSFTESGREKSFQRIAGRKIPSVLSAGGDGYGGSYGVFGQSSHHRDDSQTSIYHDDFVNARPFAASQTSMSAPSTPVRNNPFDDPPSADRNRIQNQRPFSPPPNFSRPSTSRDFGSPGRSLPSSYESRPQFSPIATSSEGFATLRPSPARTPVTQSPIISAVRIPQPSSTPPLMAGYVPDLPPVPALDLPPRGKRDMVGRSLMADSGSASQFSARSASNMSGKTNASTGRFREDIR